MWTRGCLCLRRSARTVANAVIRRLRHDSCAAVSVARANAAIQPKPIQLAPVKTYRDRWVTPFDKDPFDVPMAEKLDLKPESGYRVVPVYNYGYRLERLEAPAQ